MDREKWLKPGETLDDLRAGGVKIIQKKDGYRFSLDPVLLCGFARVGEGMAVADLGTGTGVIPLLLARRSGAGRILGVEIQPEMAERAWRSVRLNGMEGLVEILELDVRALRGRLDPQGFDLVLSNPPFRREGTGRQASGKERAAARHERAGGLEDFLEGASYLLKDGGRCCLVHLPERLPELLTLMCQFALEPKRLRCVHSRSGEVARLVLVEGTRRGRPGLCVEPPLYVYEGEGYSGEVLAMYGETASFKLKAAIPRPEE